LSSKNIEEAMDALTNIGAVRSVTKGEVLYRQGEPNSGLFLVLSGQLETYLVDEDLQTQRTLQISASGQLAGITALTADVMCDSLRALTDGKVCCLNGQVRNELMSGEHRNSKDYITVLQHSLLGQDAHKHHQRRADDVRSPVVDALVKRAVDAQASLFELPEEQIDELIKDIADAVNRQAWELADAAINETGMGVVAHRVQKIMLGTLEIAASLQGQPGSGELVLESPSVDAMKVPMGVVLGLVPVTNPVETLVFKVLIALKSRNAILLSCHRKAQHVSQRALHIIREVLIRYGINADVAQIPNLPPKRELTQLLMSHEDVSFILATGGTNMVRSAYRSGTPSIGVGKGNAPVWVCADADIHSAAAQIVSSKAFDNGVVCGSENNLLIDARIESDFSESLISEGAVILNRKETMRLMNSVFSEGKLDEQWFGKSAQQICQAAGIHRKYAVELIVVPVDVKTADTSLLREKLAPIVSMVTVQSDAEALMMTRTILADEGKGHTAIVHSHDQQKINAFAQAADVCRILVNSPGTQGCIGACNGLALSWTLGCGTSGGSSTSDNVTYHHLQNTKRIARNTQAAAASRKLA
jgi:acetaldehyde dehydrogenase/alcohol dehydrogenase